MALSVGAIGHAEGLATSSLTLSSFAHDGNYLVVLVSVGYRDSAYTLSCTFNGVDVPVITDGGYTSNRGVTAFGKAVSAATADVVVTFTGVEATVAITAISVSGSPGVVAAASPTPVNGSSGDASFTLSITATTAAGELVIDAWALRDTTAATGVSSTVGANQTERNNNKSGTTGLHVWNLVSTQAGADGGVMTWDASNPGPDACFYSGVAVVLQEGGGGGGSTGAAQVAYAQQ